MLQLQAAVVGVKATPKGVRGLTRCLWHRPAAGSLTEEAGMRMDGSVEAAAAATTGGGLGIPIVNVIGLYVGLLVSFLVSWFLGYCLYGFVLGLLVYWLLG